MKHHQQFYTTNSARLTKPVANFIGANGNGTIVDPFAGQETFLRPSPITLPLAMTSTLGLGWDVNDSLGSIPANDNSALCITNPPCLSKSMVRRKGVAAAPPYSDANPGLNNL